MKSGTGLFLRVKSKTKYAANYSKRNSETNCVLCFDMTRIAQKTENGIGIHRQTDVETEHDNLTSLPTKLSGIERQTDRKRAG